MNMITRRRKKYLEKQKWKPFIVVSDSWTPWCLY